MVGASGTLAVMVGGDEETLEAAHPILDQLATDIVHVGDVGAGQMTKLCNNMLTAIITTALGEILVTGVKAGVELGASPRRSKGSAGNYVLSGYLPNTLFTDERNASFALSLMRKDLACSSAPRAMLAWSCHSATSFLRYIVAHAEGLDDADSTSIAELYERAADVRLHLAPARQEVTT